MWMGERGEVFFSCEKVYQTVIAAVAVVSSLFVKRNTGGIDN
jgi:hypothetical protein